MKQKLIISIGTSLSHSGGWVAEIPRYLTVGKSDQIVAACLDQNGTASPWGLDNVHRLVDLRPDIALIEFATNDAGTSNGISVSESKANATTIVNAIRGGSPHTEIFLMTMNPMIGHGADARPNLADYYNGYIELAPQIGVGLIDAFTGWGTPTSDQMPDNIHPTLDAWKEKLLPLVAAALDPLID